MTDWRRVLSNFWVEPFLYNGKQYSSAEHAFHAEKFYMVASLRRGEQQKAAKAYADQFSTEFSQLSDADIKKRGGKSGFAMTTQEVNRWAEISEERMTSVLEHKFTQCHIAKRVLLATGNSTLVVDTRGGQAETTSQAAIPRYPNRCLRAASKLIVGQARAPALAVPGIRMLGVDAAPEIHGTLDY
ncbi:hypothetical protein CYMTET_11034 [Cymbomonas tetramitiformis]|uniref:NADAR domain-containing protein n=1 Tax=Cymbomonas tetramitiformis TaxID=36881 RepID=A0AAE0GMZ4_9CHLO|nr:hypothetical protein CYMTET_11034 [Cymbomonas tetramitiformis]